MELALAPSAISYGAGSIWTTHPLDNVVTGFELATRTSTLIPVGRSASDIAADETAAWVVNDLDHSVTRIDIETVSTTIDFTGDQSGDATVFSPAGVDIGLEQVWITMQGIYPAASENG